MGRKTILALVVAALFAVPLAVGSVAWWLWQTLFFTPPIEVPDDAGFEERIEAIDAWADALHERNQLNGGILILRDGQVALKETWGITDLETRAPLTATTRFRLASVSKQFTAVGVLVLIDQGRLTLDTPVADVLEGFPYPDVVVRDLLQHTSGIDHDYMALARGREDDLGPVLTIAEVAQLVAEAPPKQHAPAGTANRYSNTDSVLAAAVVEAVTGRSFEEHMRDEVFTPLGLSARVWNLASDRPRTPDMAADFDAYGGEPIEPTWIDGVAGDGAIFASLDDFVRWDAFWEGDQDLLDPALLALATSPGVLRDGTTIEYGFGWVIDEAGVWHNGAWLGANTYIDRFDEPRLTIVVLENGDSLRVGAICRRIREVLGVR